MAFGGRLLVFAVASAICLVVAAVCGESLHFRTFWPDFFVLLSLGFVMLAVLAGSSWRSDVET